MNHRSVSIAVIGGGAAGLSAACTCARSGCDVLLIERSEEMGGVLNQCIHNGFGLHYFKEELTGPEYAGRLQQTAATLPVQQMLNTAVLKIDRQADDTFLLTLAGKNEGITLLHAKAVICSTGCRERCRSNLGIPGMRLAGVFSAGLAQQMLNREGLLPGHRAVIVGSGDIGLIMARRLSWSGIPVECVVEIQPYPAGLSRNIAQCLEDFNIPLLLASTVVDIRGRGRVESVTIAPMLNGRPDLTRKREIPCDTVLFSVGLVPENELLRQCGCPLSPVTGGAVVDETMMTAIPGLFACGNALHVHDLVDFASAEAERCANGAVRYVLGERDDVRRIGVRPGPGVRYTVPSRIPLTGNVHFFLRASGVMDKAVLTLKDAGNVLQRKALRFVRPAEMISWDVPAMELAPDASLTVELEEVR